jgi:hypothetical protein
VVVVVVHTQLETQAEELAVAVLEETPQHGLEPGLAQ